MSLYTQPPPDSTVICVDELGPVTPRTFPPAPGWSPDGHRIKAHLEYGRGPDKAWVYGGLTPQDGQTLTMTAHRRNSDNYCRFLSQLEQSHPQRTLYSTSSPTTSPAIPVSKPGPGWKIIPVSSISLSPKERPG